MADRVQDIIAETFQLAPEDVTDDLEFGVSHEWDSITHMNLMLALEEAFGISIPDDTVVELTTCRAVREYVGRVTGESSANA